MGDRGRCGGGGQSQHRKGTQVYSVSLGSNAGCRNSMDAGFVSVNVTPGVAISIPLAPDTDYGAFSVQAIRCQGGGSW